MISGLPRVIVKVQDDTVAVIKMLIAKKSYEEIAQATGLDLKVIVGIKEIFESD
ncbi:hypothetical protein [Peribacillus sp. SCS-155]|uniref:hypothetical protein n=1 Tax=Peribacillus sedimenti TaxID=3115297 RepID=UPI0039063C57